MLIATVTAALTLLVAAGCGTQESATGAAASGASGTSGKSETLTIGVTAAPTTFDPAKGYFGGFEQMMRGLVDQPLLTLDPKTGEPVPDLATFRYVGNDNKSFVLTLRKGLKFSDGTPVDAKALKAWIEYVSKTPNLSTGLLSLSSIDTEGPLAVRIELKTPNPDLPYIFGASANYPWISSLADPKSLATSTAGAGPYMLEPDQTVSGDHYTFVRNPHYTGSMKVGVDKLVVRVIPSPSSLLQSVQSGEITVAQTSDPKTARAEAQAGGTVGTVSSSTYSMIFMDRGGALSKPLGDLRVRQALNYAVDRGAINAAINGEYGSPTSVIGAIDVPSDPSLVSYYDEDLAKAKSLLAEAGYDGGFTLPILCAAEAKTVCGAVAQELAAIGVKLELQTPASGDEFTADVASRRFPALISPLAFDSTVVNYGLIYAENGLFNQHGAKDPEVERLFQGVLTGTPEQAAADKAAIVKSSVVNADFVPLFVSPTFYLAAPGGPDVEVEEGPDAFYRSALMETLVR